MRVLRVDLSEVAKAGFEDLQALLLGAILLLLILDSAVLDLGLEVFPKGQRVGIGGVGPFLELSVHVGHIAFVLEEGGLEGPVSSPEGDLRVLEVEGDRIVVRAVWRFVKDLFDEVVHIRRRVPPV